MASHQIKKARGLQLHIADDFGVDHHYTIHPFGASKGLRLLPRIVKVFAQALGEVASAMDMGGMNTASKAVAGKGAAEALALKDVVAMAKQAGMASAMLDGSVDTAKLGAALAVLAVRLEDEGGPEFVRQILALTERADASGTNGFLLGDEAAFDAAFSGNYGELGLALFHTIKLNWGAVFSRIPFGQSSGAKE